MLISNSRLVPKVPFERYFRHQSRKSTEKKYTELVTIWLMVSVAPCFGLFWPLDWYLPMISNTDLTPRGVSYAGWLEQ